MPSKSQMAFALDFVSLHDFSLPTSALTVPGISHPKTHLHSLSQKRLSQKRLSEPIASHLL
jgi:hypothetical protein